MSRPARDRDLGPRSAQLILEFAILVSRTSDLFPRQLPQRQFPSGLPGERSGQRFRRLSAHLLPTPGVPGRMPAEDRWEEHLSGIGPQQAAASPQPRACCVTLCFCLTKEITSKFSVVPSSYNLLSSYSVRWPGKHPFPMISSHICPMRPFLRFG